MKWRAALPWILGQAEPLISLADTLRSSKQHVAAVALDAANALFRGVSQVCFGDNPLTGAICYIALLAPMPPPYALCVTLGLLSSTLTAVACASETSAVRHGLFGFNGVLAGAAIATYFAFDTPAHYAAHAMLTLAAGALATCLSRALAVSFAIFSLPTFTMPFNAATLIILAGIKATGASNASPDVWHVFALADTGGGGVITPSPATACFTATGRASLSSATCTYEALSSIMRGVAQVYFCDSAASGTALVAAFALCSPITAIACTCGSALGMVAAAILGAPPGEIAAGLWGYNSVIAAAAVTGVFYEFDTRACIAAVGASLLAALMQGCYRTLFAPLALPVLTMPFVTCAAIMLSQRWPVRVALDRVATPEAHAVCHALKCHGVFVHVSPAAPPCASCAEADLTRARATATVHPLHEVGQVQGEHDADDVPAPLPAQGAAQRGRGILKSVGVSRPYLMQQPSRRLLFAWRRSSDPPQAEEQDVKAQQSAYGALDAARRGRR